MAADDAQAEQADPADNRILCLTGPESSGKTQLAGALAVHFGAHLVPEVARGYLTDRPDYDSEDVLTIARRQVAAETRALESGNDLIVCDTDLTVIQVWWEEKYGALPDSLIQALQARKPRIYLLLQPDLPWAEDPLRENPHDRQQLFERYQALLDAGPFPHAVVAGSGDERLISALDGIQALRPGWLTEH